MDNQRKQVIGSWISVIGTVTSAVGSTPFEFIREEKRNGLNAWGNVLQAGGNALQAEGEENISLDKIGNEIQSIGNVMVFLGLLIDFEGDTEKRLIIIGNWLQALGGIVTIGEDFENFNDREQAYKVTGNLLQVIGNSLQALGDISGLRENANKKIEEKKEQEGRKGGMEGRIMELHRSREEYTSGESLNITGSWMQAVGSVLSLMGQIKEAKKEKKEAE